MWREATLRFVQDVYILLLLLCTYHLSLNLSFGVKISVKMNAVRRFRRRSRLSWAGSDTSSTTSRNLAQQRAKLFDSMPDHTNMIYIMTVGRFVLMFLIVSAWLLRNLAYILIFVGLYFLKLIDVCVYIFHRVFSNEPERINQNPDYTHIEGKNL